MKVWDWLKGHTEWVMGLACVGLGVWSFFHDDTVGGFVCIGIGVALVVVLKLLVNVTVTVQSFDKNRPLTYEQGEIDHLTRLGLEPVPVPGEYPIHNRSTCETCELIWRRERDS